MGHPMDIILPKGLVQEGKQDTCCDGGADHTCHIGTHGMLEQIVGLVVLKTHVVGHTGSIGDGADTGVADERIDFATLLEEEVEELDEQHATEGGDDERQGTQSENHDGTAREERGGLSGGTHGKTDEEGADVDDGVAGHIAQTLGDTTLLEEVTKEEHAQQGQTRRNHEGTEKEADDGEDDLL